MEWFKNNPNKRRTKTYNIFNIKIVFCFLFLISCKEITTLPNKTGALNEILVVLDNKKIEKKIDKYFNKEKEGLPQKEKIFNAVYIKKEAFSNIFKTHRNIVLIQREKKDTSFFIKNNWAKDQLVLVIKYKKEEEIEKSLTTKNIKEFQKKEKERIIKKYKKEETFKIGETTIKIKTPKEYFTVFKKEKMFFIRKETPKKTYGIWGFSTGGFIEDQKIIKERNKIVKENFFGEKKDTYMITEEKYPTVFKKEGETTTARGLWKIKGDFLGGPFVLKKRYNKKNNETIFLEGFLFFPEEKRNSLMEIETILENTKIN